MFKNKIRVIKRDLVNDDHVIEFDTEDNLSQCTVVQQEDMSVNEVPNHLNTGTVCLVQVTKIPARHQKMVRAKVTDECCYRGIPAMFESSSDMMETHQLLPLSILTYLDHHHQFTLILENHGCQPIYLQTGHIVRHIEDAVVCPPERMQDSENIVSPLTVNTLLVESTAQHTTPITNTAEAAKQEW